MVKLIEHLLSDERKAKKLHEVLKALKLRIEMTSNGRGFNIVEQ